MSDCCSSQIHVVGLGQSPVISFAAQELARCLGKMTGQDVPVSTAYKVQDEPCLQVGLTSSFPGKASLRVPDPRLDDAILIELRGTNGIVSGNNPRSVLLAVYRLLTEMGCRWVRPGKDGEILPRIDRFPVLRIQERPDYRHRAICIEGAVSIDHVWDMVDWIPKLGFNGYFIQFREAHTFFDRWYRHVDNTVLQGKPLSLAKARQYTERVEEEIERRGLIYHKVGHGWTCEPFGIPGLGWDKETREAEPEVAQYLALVKGERTFWGGVALNTNLCYSNSEVRRKMVEEIVCYAEKHPRVDLLHIWLADGSNNNCECEACQKARPSDFYVRILNEADAELTRRHLNTKLVFLIYVDLLWPPLQERFQSPDRFVLMFAPIVRTYSQTLKVLDRPQVTPPFERNALVFPKSVDVNVAFLKAWQKIFSGDSFDFDYHLMWDHDNDPGHMQVSKTLCEDMKGLRDIGLNGFVSCQIQRVFFPTALPMVAMGKTLWDRGVKFDGLCEDYFSSAFGPDGALCKEYLTRISDLFDPVALRREKDTEGEERVQKLAQVRTVVEEFAPVVARNLKSKIPAQARSWAYLTHHAEIICLLADALLAKAQGTKEESLALAEKLKTLCWQKEPEIHRVFDPWLFVGRFGGWFR